MRKVRLGSSVTLLGTLLLGLAHAPPGIATPLIERATPASIPPYIEIDVTVGGCDTKAMTKDYVAIWYATIKAKTADLGEGYASIDVYLINPLTGKLLLNAGGRAHQEGGYLVRSISFDSTILEQVVFRWRDSVSRAQVVYEIHLTDFYSGERC